jgi:hypothetical protein
MDERFLVQHGVFRQHPVEIGAKPIGEVFRPDRSAKPARMKRPSNPVADLDPRHAVADCSDLARAVRKRHDAEFGRTATAAFEDHQIAVIERSRAHPHHDLPQSGPRVLARPQHDPVNTAEAVDAISFHLFLPLLTRGGRSFPGCLSAVADTLRV